MDFIEGDLQENASTFIDKGIGRAERTAFGNAPPTFESIKRQHPDSADCGHAVPLSAQRHGRAHVREVRILSLMFSDTPGTAISTSYMDSPSDQAMGGGEVTAHRGKALN
jgi:hypothetical protein